MPGYVKFILIVYSRFPLISFLLPLFPSYWLFGRNTTLRRSFLSLKTILLLYPLRLYFTFTGAKSITSLSRSGSCLQNSSMLSHKSSSLYQQVISPYRGRPLPGRPAFLDFVFHIPFLRFSAIFLPLVRLSWNRQILKLG